MTAQELESIIREALARGAPIGDYHGILVDFSRSGSREEAMRILRVLLDEKPAEPVDDRIREIMDFVEGWCRPIDRIWPDQ